MWSLTREEGNYGFARKALRGHSHFVQDVVISSDGQFCLSGSWDGTLRLWDINSGSTTRRFLGHTKDVLSVAFSVDNRQVHAWAGMHTLGTARFGHVGAAQQAAAEFVRAPRHSSTRRPMEQQQQDLFAPLIIVPHASPWSSSSSRHGVWSAGVPNAANHSLPPAPFPSMGICVLATFCAPSAARW